ncbi:excalibur calcium-binding domain-containing protein [Neobacillus dielmonensis]|uniref:excalibur calcium-binding domain-containing protein n=1 Tax=Neobacillus dielmonensis TaxID=1347369 RepID=UPI0005AA5A21|nr:excalibur calcium-binding domain-containing protein [Neobacillus dielmonensis]
MKKWFAALFTFVLLSSVSTIGAKAQDMDCKDFSTHGAVMDFWYNNGYSATNDPHDLDRDNDGLPCEVTKAEYDTYVAQQKAAGGSAGGTTGGTMPNTATYDIPMVIAGAGIAAVGLYFLLRRRKVIE